MVGHPRRSRWLVLVAASLLAGCGHAPRRGPGAPAPSSSPKLDVGGTWSWSFDSSDGDGNRRSEREVWRLTQRGDLVEGEYDRRVLVEAADGRVFRCNHGLRINKETQVRLAGRIHRGMLELREVEHRTTPSPCDDGARLHLTYHGRMEGDRLRLEWAPGEGETLARVSAAPSSPTNFLSASASASVAGRWRWSRSGLDHQGDTLEEFEEWQLEEKDGSLDGFLQRRVVHRRVGGVFACNRTERYEVVTRYRVHGQRWGDHLTLVERDYQATPSPCDNGRRRLDSYSGTLASDGQTLVLSWGPGSQILRRVDAGKTR